MTRCSRNFIRDDDETEVEVEFEIESWGCGPTGPSFNYPGDPGEPVEGYLVSAETVAGVKVELTDAEKERMETAFFEDPPEPPEPYYYDD